MLVLGSKTKTASGDRSVSNLVTDLGSDSEVGSGFSAVGKADSWLGSGSGVWLAMSA